MAGILLEREVWLGDDLAATLALYVAPEGDCDALRRLGRFQAVGALRRDLEDGVEWAVHGGFPVVLVGAALRVSPWLTGTEPRAQGYGLQLPPGQASVAAWLGTVDPATAADRWCAWASNRMFALPSTAEARPHRRVEVTFHG